MKRLFDILVSLIILTIFALPMMLIALVVRLSSRGPAFYWSDRVGFENNVFRMPKFRTMRVDTPEMGKHLLPGEQDWVTPVGRFLRKTSLDELPQVLSILRGRMSFVGPRPVLPNEKVLIAMRTLQGVHRVKPGLTGWAQINGRAELKVQEKLEFDVEYVKKRSFFFDIRIMFLTAGKVIRRKDVDQESALKEPESNH
ncbi:MAG: O-antigen biosynthesis protein WbqP [Verrucomicrobiales bacterium]|jgi:O-antigen biosynthesis protein WbqP